jgi:hypothetical protein
VKAEKKAAEWKAVAQALFDALNRRMPYPLLGATPAMQAYQYLKSLDAEVQP